MRQDQPYGEDLLATLACDIGARPVEAPHLADVAAATRAVRREETTLLVDYDPAIAERVAAVVAAERLCCAVIGWHLDGPVSDASTAAGAPAHALRLRIEASPAQLDAIQLLLGHRLRE